MSFRDLVFVVAHTLNAALAGAALAYLLHT